MASLKGRVRELIESEPDDRKLSITLQKLAQQETWRFPETVKFWGPLLYRRNRAVFLPLIERYGSPWALRGVKDLEGWLAEAEANADLRLYRLLYQTWLADALGWKDQTARWRSDFLAAFRDAGSRAERRDVTVKFDLWLDLDDDMVVELYGVDPVVTRDFVRKRLARAEWVEVVYERAFEAALAAGDADFAFAMYRSTFRPEVWASDVARLCETVSEPLELDRELERRHPTGQDAGVDPVVLLELLRRRGADVLPYLNRRVPDVESWGRGKDWEKLASYAEEHGWLGLWATVVSTQLGHPEFSATVKRLCINDARPEWQRASQLVKIAGTKVGWAEWKTIAALEESAAVELYSAFPHFCRGAFAPHFVVTPQTAYRGVAEQAEALQDWEMIDVLAASAVRSHPDFYARAPVSNLDWYFEHYASLGAAAFADRAVDVLARVAPFDRMLAAQQRRLNPLYELFFGEADRYGTALPRVRDLLEAPAEDARRVGLRLLGRADAGAAAVANLDHLMAYLLDEATRSTRIAAFRGLARAAEHSEEAAQRVAERARQTLDLRRRSYPRDRLVELLGRVLAAAPRAATPAERAVVFRREAS